MPPILTDTFVSGYVTVWDTWINRWWANGGPCDEATPDAEHFQTMIRRGSFADVIAGGLGDIALWFSHGKHPEIQDVNLGEIVELVEDEYGLFYRARLHGTPFYRYIVQRLDEGLETSPGLQPTGFDLDRANPAKAGKRFVVDNVLALYEISMVERGGCPGSAGWFDLDLGTVNIKELPSGHTCEFRIEAKTTSGVPTVDIDYLRAIPADTYLKLRGSIAAEVASGGLVATDDFSTQTAGAVSGKTPLFAPSGNWSGAGDADDFQVDTSNQRIYRTALSDSAANNGRYLRCGTGNLILATVECDWKREDTGIPGETFRQGIFLRYTDTSNWLFAGYATTGVMTVIKRVAGTETVLALATGDFRGNRKLRCSVDASGNVVVYESPASQSLSLVMSALADSSLATAGALATGGYGIYDAETAANYVPRYYDNFAVTTLATSATIVSPAAHDNQPVVVTHQTSTTTNADGSATSTTPIREGNYPLLQPATRSGNKSRVVVSYRTNDIDAGFADEIYPSSRTASLDVTPRVHLVGG